MDESWKYIVRARKMIIEDKYDKAFGLFLVAFDRNPDLISDHATEFRTVLLTLNTVLADTNRIDIICSNFDRALRRLPNDTILINEIGKYMYKFGFYMEALDHFEQVLKITPTSANTEKNINSIKNLLVERWHYRMLNDNLRNESYRRAIHQTVSEDDNVLDVGTGTGLLAIYACEAGAHKVIGCDGSKIMSTMANTIACWNKIRKIKVINKMSIDLTLWDLGGRCSVLVTEMFDAGLFGEHVLQMLSHAWTFLLTKQPKIIPNTAEFFVMGTQCDHLSINYKLGSDAKTLLNISSLNVHVYPDDEESYDCEDVHLIKDIKYLTQPHSVLKINFNDLDNIKENLQRIEPYTVELIAKEEGTMNIIIGWFNLYLSDTVTITTDPRAPDRANAWQQAIFFDNIPKTVRENESIHLEFLMNGGKLTLAPSPKEPIIRVTSDVIRFLNDTEYMKMISGCIGIACVYLEQIKELSEIHIADLCPFPFFGLQMLKRGVKSLLCCATNKHDKEFIEKIFSENQIQMSKVTILIGDDWTSEIFEDQENYHLIFTHTLEVCGDINLRLQHIADYLKRVKLAQGGLFMPAQIKLVAQLVSSHWLDLNNRLYDDNVSNYKMASSLNKFKVTQNFAIDLSTLKYVPISEPTVLCNYPNAMQYEEKTVKIISDGYANAILCWYNIELMDRSQEISTNRSNSFVNGMLFLTYSKEQLITGNFAKIIQHKDADWCFKLVMEPVV